MTTQSVNRIHDSLSFKPVFVQGLNESVDGEKDPRIDGVRIIGKVVGEMFACNKKTQNNRFYPRSLWEKKVLPSCEDRYPLFGTCGHNIEFTEENIKKGELTHKVTKMWISEDGLGMAEILMMGNEFGTNLYNAMREGYPLAVSTRAYGDVQKGKGPGGSDLIVEDSFYFQTIDFVSNPGLRTAFPKVVESQNNDRGVKEKMDETLKQLHESLQKDAIETKTSLNEALKENKVLNEKLADQEKVMKAITEKFGSNPVETLDQLDEGLRKWLELEPFKGFAKSSNVFGKTSAPPMQAVLEHIFKINESYASVGSPEVCKEAKELCEKYSEYGTLDEMEKAYVALKGYTALKKSPSDIAKLVERAEKLVSIYKDTKVAVAAKQISEKFKVNKEAVCEMLKKDSAKNVIENLKKLGKINEAAPAPAAPAAGNRVATNQAAVTIPTTEKNKSKVASIFESVKQTESKQSASHDFLKGLNRARK